MVCLVPCFSACLCFLLVIDSLSRKHGHHAGGRSVPNGKKAAMCVQRTCMC